MAEGNLNFEEGLQFLCGIDSTLCGIIKATRPVEPDFRQANFEGLVKIIVSQQLSGQAAGTIFFRLKELLNVIVVTPQSIRNVDNHTIKSCGISNAKAAYIRNLQIHFDEHPDFIDVLKRMTIDEMIEELMKLKGIGEWSARIFTLFHLRHPNIFAYGDNTIYTAVNILYGEGTASDPKSLELLIQKWSPFNSIACLVLWWWVDSGKPQI